MHIRTVSYTHLDVYKRQIQVGSSLTNDYEYVITGRTVLSQVIDNLDMDETYEQLSNCLLYTSAQQQAIPAQAVHRHRAAHRQETPEITALTVHHIDRYITEKR